MRKDRRNNAAVAKFSCYEEKQIKLKKAYKLKARNIYSNKEYYRKTKAIRNQ